MDNNKPFYDATDVAQLSAERLTWKLTAIIALAGCVFWFGAWVFAVTHFGG